jgi:hypothetical protein
VASAQDAQRYLAPISDQDLPEKWLLRHRRAAWDNLSRRLRHGQQA